MSTSTGTPPSAENLRYLGRCVAKWALTTPVS